MSTKGVAPVSIKIDLIPHLETCFSELIKEKLEKYLLLLRGPTLGIGRTMERLVRRLKMPERFTFVTIPAPSLLALCNNSRNWKVLFLFRELHLPELKIKKFSNLFW